MKSSLLGAMAWSATVLFLGALPGSAVRAAGDSAYPLGANQAPIVGSPPIYRTLPGNSVALPIDAVDPEGTALQFTSDDLPAGANLDPDTGIFSWVPGLEHLGPVYVHFTVTDSGNPPRSSDSILIFQVLPPDNCDDVVCDPASGCIFTPRPISTPCCQEEPDIRVAEPEAPCPTGRVLHVGRNARGFGRIQNCDLLRVEFFGQGGANVNLNFEARCVKTERLVEIRAHLETADETVFDSVQTVQLQSRPDGFAHALGLTFPVGFLIDVFSLDGKEAQLTATLTDADGVTVERSLRVTLSLFETDDLPNPIQVVPPSGEVGCVSCHEPVNPITQMRMGIENPHPYYPLSCTDCHGGNDQTNNYAEAHVFPASGPTYIRNLAYDKLDEVPLDYLQFVNPGDFRVAAFGCGASSPAGDATGCHQSIVDSAPFSVMATFAGHYKLPRFMAGGQGRDPVVAAVDVVDTDYNPATAPTGTVANLTALREPVTEDRSELIGAMDIYLSKSCASCHQSDFGTNYGPGKYRSSGCTSCHMVYDDDGLSRSNDPAIVGYFPPHPIKHEITSAIPTEQCAHCHFQGGRIGLSFRGIREGGFSAENTPPDALPWDQSIYGHDPGFYFVDEDATNGWDETPPDLHFTAGMACMDCHVGGDVHGDGFIYASERDQVGIRCEDCHGSVRDAIEEDPADGFFKNSKGYPLKRVRREGGAILLKLANEDRDLEIAQIFDLIQAGQNGRMTHAMGVQPNGFSHTDTLQCYTCHNSWRPNCFGCHISINDDLNQLNLTTGEITQGRFSAVRDDYSTDFFALGMDSDGKISPLCSSMSIFLSYREDGSLHYTDRVRQTTDGKTGFGWNPFHHHTVSRTPMNCDSCHPTGSVESPTNADLLDATYGFGNGEMMATDGDGTSYDLTAFLDSGGNQTSSFPHPNTGPVPTTIRERALSILVTPHSRAIPNDDQIYDVNFDGAVGSTDLQLVIDAILERTIPPGVYTDVDKNGETNIFDLTQLIAELKRIQ